MKTTLTPDTNDLREIAMLPTESALPRAARFLSDLVKDTRFVQGEILPLLKRAKYARDWYVARQYDGEDDSYTLKTSSGPRGPEPESTTIPRGVPMRALPALYSRSATTAWTTAP